MVESLTRDERLVLLLRYYSGLNIFEIGAVLGKPPSDVDKLHESMSNKVIDARAELLRRLESN